MVYLDTSALAKRYLSEPQSDRFDAFLVQQRRGRVSTLAAVEMRCLIGRRTRSGDLTDDAEARVLAAFEEDLLVGMFDVFRVSDTDLWAAFRLVGELRAQALRTLDALHLACAMSSGSGSFATADRRLAEAAEAVGMPTHTFFDVP